MINLNSKIHALGRACTGHRTTAPNLGPCLVLLKHRTGLPLLRQCPTVHFLVELLVREEPGFQLLQLAMKCVCIRLFASKHAGLDVRHCRLEHIKSIK